MSLRKRPYSMGSTNGCSHTSSNTYKPDLIIRIRAKAAGVHLAADRAAAAAAEVDGPAAANAANGAIAVVADTTIAYESYTHSMHSAYAHKINKYTEPEFIAGVEKKYSVQKVITLPFVVGARGCWHPLNDRLLHLLGVRPAIKQCCANAVFQWGSSIHRHFNQTTWRTSPHPHPRSTWKKMT